jgi:hypothetical protein
MWIAKMYIDLGLVLHYLILIITNSQLVIPDYKLKEIIGWK